MILLCWVFGDPERISVEISPEKTVDELKDAIFAKKPDRFRGIDAYLLVLWKKIIPVRDLNRLHQSDLKDEDELDATWTIGKYFEEAPQKEGIHIVIKVPEPPNVEWHTTLSPRRQHFSQFLSTANGFLRANKQKKAFPR
jgi:crinkler effector protein